MAAGAAADSAGAVLLVVVVELLVSVVVDEELDSFLPQPAAARATVRTAIMKRTVSFLVTWVTSFHLPFFEIDLCVVSWFEMSEGRHGLSLEARGR